MSETRQLPHEDDVSTTKSSEVDMEAFADEQDNTWDSDDKLDLSWPGIKNYILTRPTTLFQLPKADISALNPIPGIKAMDRTAWNFYMLGFLAWTIDSMDFFCVSVSASEIAATLEVDITSVTWGMTLVLMFRSVGAVIFGLASDYYGRKWPYITCCLLFVALEIGTGFVQTLKQFLGVRAIFGIAMGGMYGCASATALENAPPVSRSILSGLFLPGYNLGFIFASIFFRAFEGTYKEGEGWRSLFWFSAGPAALLLVWRLFTPESPHFLKQQEAIKIYNQRLIEKGHGHLVEGAAWREAKQAIKDYWLVFVYLIFLMSGFNFTSHGSQDLFPTFLTQQVGLAPDTKTVTTVVVNLGAIAGGLIIGQLSELLGRRLTMIVGYIGAAVFIYPSFMVIENRTITAGDFFLSFFVMGNWGIIPQHLQEVCHPKYRAFAAGLAYQLGNLASSASSTIESEIGKRFPITLKNGTHNYNYGKVMAIFCAAVFIYMIIAVFIGHERFHREFDTMEMKALKLEDEDVGDVTVTEKVGTEHIE